jgi:spore maturation protein CgeB
MTEHSDLRVLQEHTALPKYRIMLVGNYMWPWYQEVCAKALEELGCEVERFGWFDDFHHWREGHSEPFYHSHWHRIQYRLHTGPTVWKVSRNLLQRTKLLQPDIIWFYNVQLISPAVVKAMRRECPNATFVQYANDNPFSSLAKQGLWRNFLNSIPLFDVHFSYRMGNINDYRQQGAKYVYLLRSYFVSEDDYQVPHEEIPEQFKSDVVFAGHYEDDGRVKMLEAVCDAGFHLNLFGGGWNKALPRLRADSPLRDKYPVSPATGVDYRYAICGAKVALCFLSTINRDTYTRRSFQIPAMRTAMLSQYTDDLAGLYEEHKEVVFFRNQQELLENLQRLVYDDNWRQSVAEAGHVKVYTAGHDVKSRMRVLLEQTEKFHISNS